MELQKHYEDFLQRETLFVQQCYAAGVYLWWRRVLRIGLTMPPEAEIKQWILNGTYPGFWRGFNPRVMKLAHIRFNSRTATIRNELRYAEKMLEKCEYQDWLNIESHIAEKLLTKQSRMKQSICVKHQ